MIDKSQLPNVKGEYRFDAKINNWFDLRGRAEILFRPKNAEDLSYFLQNISPQFNVQIIGAGSNVIVADEGLKGVLIKLPATFAEIYHDENTITIGSASLCINVAQYCKNFGLGGLEFLSGIPGSIGGAIAMNAGCYGSDIAQNLISASAIDYEGNFCEIKNSDFGFVYRGNNLSKKYIFIAGKFKINNSTTQEIAHKIAELQKARENAQPIRAKTGGSTFKNPPNKKAWELIDAIGYRGKSIGDAQISQKHCNCLINNNLASAQDLIKLGEEAREKVFEQFKINLEWEIKILK
jgi:UDP-N-acetylmuramate dehydrogenase